ncbi:hypothetical protein, partial [Streptococcus pneumoniae]|uniref:hypothetical protein n=1 Tax=Streptococcus pneumoniae TaxID=1313 RepID=UPI00195302EC
FSYAQPWLQWTFLTIGDGKITLADLWRIPYWAGALEFASMVIVILALVEHLRPWHDELGRDFDGDFGAASGKPAS